MSMTKSKRKKKAAIELSLGFVVLIVFAVVLLSLAVVWLRGVLIGITGLTTDLTQQAQDQISTTFRQTTNNFAIYPSRYDMQPATTLITSAGIKNNDPEGRDLEFIVVIRCLGTDAIGGDCNIHGNYWEVTFPNTSTYAPHNIVAFRDITFQVKQGTPNGNYLFEAVACYADPDSTGFDDIKASECPPPATTDPNYDPNVHRWGTAQPITFTVKG
jgi:hypothetical protein